MAAAAISDHHQSKIRLPGDASMYTAELQALKMAFNLIKDDRSKEFIIFSDSLSSLMALQGSKYDHPYIVELLHTYTHLCSQNKSVILALMPSHVGIRGNEEMDILAKEALGLNLTPLWTFWPRKLLTWTSLL